MHVHSQGDQQRKRKLRCSAKREGTFRLLFPQAGGGERRLFIRAMPGARGRNAPSYARSPDKVRAAGRGHTRLRADPPGLQESRGGAHTARLRGAAVVEEPRSPQDSAAAPAWTLPARRRIYPASGASWRSSVRAISLVL